MQQGRPRKTLATKIVGEIGLLEGGDSKPLSVRIFHRIRELIIAGALPPGSKLPSSRSLAFSLGVSRNSILWAMDELLSDGWVTTRRGSGAYVALRPPLTRQTRQARTKGGSSVPALRPFEPGVPAIDLFPLRTWSRLQAKRWSAMPRLALREGHGPGWPALREAVSDYLRIARGLDCQPGQIFITTGARAALTLALQVLGASRRTFYMEDPGYWGFRDAVRLLGGRIVPIPVDDHGFNIEVAMAADHEGWAAIVTPACQFPTCVEMAGERRRKLSDWALASRGWIFEDDHDSHFWYESRPQAPLAAGGAASRTLYFNSFHDVLFSSLGIGYLMVPEALMTAFAQAIDSIALHTNIPNQMVLSDFINGGYLDEHVRGCRIAYAERRTTLIRVCGDVLATELELTPRPFGSHIVARLRRRSESEFVDLAAANDVAAMGLASHGVTQLMPPAVMLGFCGYSPSQIEHAGNQLAVALAGDHA